jgi:hypothetical protein
LNHGVDWSLRIKHDLHVTFTIQGATMLGQGSHGSTRRVGFYPGILLAFLGSLLFLVNGVRAAQANEPANEEPVAQNMDMDHHDHAAGAVEAMTPHQRHAGPHKKWTTVRPPNADDARRADQIVQILRQGLAKYKDYRVAMDDGLVPMHPERKPRHYHFANKQRRFLAKLRFDPAEPTALLYK